MNNMQETHFDNMTFSYITWECMVFKVIKTILRISNRLRSIVVLNSQVESYHNITELLIGKDNITRINFKSDKDLGLDSVNEMKRLKSISDQKYSYLSNDIMSFFREVT